VGAGSEAGVADPVGDATFVGADEDVDVDVDGPTFDAGVHAATRAATATVTRSARA